MLKIEVLSGDFSVCKLKAVPEICKSDKFSFLSVTDSEISLVCRTERVPESTLVREDSWRGFRVAGSLDFSLVAILSHISSLLVGEQISIFAVSTYDTDYVFTKNNRFRKALEILADNGYLIQNTEI